MLFRSDIEMRSAAGFRTKRGNRLANTVKYRQVDFYPERIIHLHSRTSDRSGKNRRTPEGAHLGTGADDGRIRNLKGGLYRRIATKSSPLAVVSFRWQKTA